MGGSFLPREAWQLIRGDEAACIISKISSLFVWLVADDW
jgi:hypothetical protein